MYSRGARSGGHEKSGCGEGLAHFCSKKVAVARERWLPMPSSRATATFFSKNAPFSSHSHFFFQKMGSWPQDGTKIGPRSPRVRLKTVLTCDRFLHRFSDRFWVVVGLRFGVLLGPQGTPKIDPSSPRWAWRATATWFSKYEPRLRREHDFHPPGSPRWHQHRPKLVLRPF